MHTGQPPALPAATTDARGPLRRPRLASKADAASGAACRGLRISTRCTQEFHQLDIGVKRLSSHTQWRHLHLPVHTVGVRAPTQQIGHDLVCAPIVISPCGTKCRIEPWRVSVRVLSVDICTVVDRFTKDLGVPFDRIRPAVRRRNTNVDQSSSCSRIFRRQRARLLPRKSSTPRGRAMRRCGSIYSACFPARGLPTQRRAEPIRTTRIQRRTEVHTTFHPTPIRMRTLHHLESSCKWHQCKEMG